MKSIQIRSFFCSVFSRIRTEYGETHRISLYSVQMRENTDQKKLRICTLFTQCQTVMSWSSRKKKGGIFCTVYFVQTEFFLRSVFYLNAQCIEHNFKTFFLHIKKRYFIQFCCLFLKSSNTFSVSLNELRFTLFELVFQLFSTVTILIFIQGF